MKCPNCGRVKTLVFGLPVRGPGVIRRCPRCGHQWTARGRESVPIRERILAALKESGVK